MTTWDGDDGQDEDSEDEEKIADNGRVGGVAQEKESQREEGDASEIEEKGSKEGDVSIHGAMEDIKEDSRNEEENDQM